MPLKGKGKKGKKQDEDWGDDDKKVGEKMANLMIAGDDSDEASKPAAKPAKKASKSKPVPIAAVGANDSTVTDEDEEPVAAPVKNKKKKKASEMAEKLLNEGADEEEEDAKVKKPSKSKSKSKFPKEDSDGSDRGDGSEKDYSEIDKEKEYKASKQPKKIALTHKEKQALKKKQKADAEEAKVTTKGGTGHSALDAVAVAVAQALKTGNYKKNKANAAFEDTYQMKNKKGENDRQKMCEEIIKLPNEQPTGARPKVKSIIHKKASHQEKRNKCQWVSHEIDGRQYVSHVTDGRQYEISIEVETVKTAANPCEIHVREQVLRKELQTFECLSSQALWCQNGDTIGDVMKCGGCWKVTYCREVCQATDWENHRALCMEEREKRARSKDEKSRTQ